MSKDLLLTRLKSNSALAVVATVFTSGGVFFLGQFFAGLCIVILLTLIGKNSNQIDSLVSDNRYIQLVLISIVAVFVILSVVKMLGWLKAPPKKFLLLEKRLTVENAIETALVYGLYFLTLVSIVFLLSVFSGVDTNQMQDLGIANPNNISGKLVIFVMLAVVTPIYEEVLFRGFLYNSLKRHGGVVFSYIATSVLFGAAHLEYNNLNWIAAIDTLVFSVFLIYISQKHKSLYSAILLHAIKNSIAFYVLFVR